jgi:hypothetical protein
MEERTKFVKKLPSTNTTDEEWTLRRGVGSEGKIKQKKM